MGMFIWPLLAALGIIGHFRLAAFGRFSSERVKEASDFIGRICIKCL